MSSCISSARPAPCARAITTRRSASSRPRRRKLQPRGDAGPMLRVDVWRAELAYFQGRYSDANASIDRALPRLEAERRLRVRCFRAAHSHRDLARPSGLRQRGGPGGPRRRARRGRAETITFSSRSSTCWAPLRSTAPRRSCDVPHARSHLSSLDPRETAPMEEDAREALHWFERAQSGRRARALRVCGLVCRRQHRAPRDRAGPRPTRRTRHTQAPGACCRRAARSTTKSSRARISPGDFARWGTIAKRCTSSTWRSARPRNGHVQRAARVPRIRPLDRPRCIGRLRRRRGRAIAVISSWSAPPNGALAGEPRTKRRPRRARRPLEPYFLKRADRFILDHLGGAVHRVRSLAMHCGVSWRTHGEGVRRLSRHDAGRARAQPRLDHARQVLGEDGATVADVAARCGFRSSTTFALEYRKRFGVSPSHARQASKA